MSVSESKSGGAVNTLYVTNESNRPLYLMGGEVVLGGQQDRTLGRDTIVPPGQKEVPVTVFCVEHGRWTGRKEFDQSAPTIASATIRASAQNGEFYAARQAAAIDAEPLQSPAAQIPSAQIGESQSAAAHYGRPGRLGGGHREQSSAVNHVGAAQQQVWDKVAEKNAKLKTESSTGTYRRALTLSGGDAEKSVPAYVTALADILTKDKRLIGVVAAVNGKVIAADVFGEPALFRKLWPKLLRSYASDAVEHSPKDLSKVACVTPAQAKEFLISATDAKSKIENMSDGSSTVRYESGQAVSYSLVPNPKSGGGFGGGKGGFGGGAVHTGVLGK